jgi:transcriptional regulator with XRE-family HTH domain
MSIGRRIADARKDRGLSQTVLGREVGTSQVMVSNWEHDLCLPPMTVRVDLAKVLGIPIHELLPEAADILDAAPTDPEEIKLLQCFRLAPPELRPAIVAVVGGLMAGSRTEPTPGRG